MSAVRVILNYLPPDLNYSQLKYLLQDLTPGFIRCNLVKIASTGESLGFGFADYDTEYHAIKACQMLSGSKMGSKTIRLALAAPREITYDGKLYVEGFPLGWNAFELAAYFSQFGQVQDCTIFINKSTGLLSDRALVRMESQYDADKARFYNHQYGAPIKVGLPFTRSQRAPQERFLDPIRQYTKPQMLQTNGPKKIAFRDNEEKWTVISATMYFAQFGEIKQCQIIKPIIQGAGARVIVVTFNDDHDADVALSMAELINLQIYPVA